MLIAQLDSKQQTSLDSRSNEILEKVEIHEISKGGYLNTEHINAAIALLRTRLGSGTFKIYRGPGSAVSFFKISGTDTGTDKSTAVLPRYRYCQNSMLQNSFLFPFFLTPSFK